MGHRASAGGISGSPTAQPGLGRSTLVLLGRDQQVQGLLGQPNPGNRAAVEGEEVLLDTVAEDDTASGHVGNELQRRLGCDSAEDDGCGGGLADERLTDAKDELLCLPVEGI